MKIIPKNFMVYKMYRDNMVEPMIIQKKKINWKKLFNLYELMAGPSGILGFVGFIIFLYQFRHPNSSQENLVVVRPILGYIGCFLMFPILTYFIYMLVIVARQILPEVNIKEWYNEVKSVWREI